MVQETLLFKVGNLKPIVMTGEASIMAGCDRRTFKLWAKKMGIEPVGTVRGGNAVYWLKDAEKVAKKYKEHLAEIEAKRGTA